MPISYRDALAPRATMPAPLAVTLPAPVPAFVPTVTFDPQVTVLPPAAPVDDPKPKRAKQPPPPRPALHMTLRTRNTPANIALDTLAESSLLLTPINAFAVAANSNLSIKKAKKIDLQMTDAALKKEMQQMLDKDIFSPVLRHTLTSDQHRITM